MKSIKLPLFGFAIVLLVSSCRKEDVAAPNVSKTVSATSVAKASGWMSLNNWFSSTTDNSTTYFSKISDTTITADVAKSGLVLVYVKTGSQTQALPFQDQATNTYWYYQVSNGSLRVNGDNSSANENFKGKNILYFVLTSQQVADLESKGKSKLDLMQLTYDQAAVLLK